MIKKKTCIRGCFQDLSLPYQRRICAMPLTVEWLVQELMTMMTDVWAWFTRCFEWDSVFFFLLIYWALILSARIFPGLLPWSSCFDYQDRFVPIHCFYSSLFFVRRLSTLLFFWMRDSSTHCLPYYLCPRFTLSIGLRWASIQGPT